MHGTKSSNICIRSCEKLRKTWPPASCLSLLVFPVMALGNSCHFLCLDYWSHLTEVTCVLNGCMMIIFATWLLKYLSIAIVLPFNFLHFRDAFCLFFYQREMFLHFLFFFFHFCLPFSSYFTIWIVLIYVSVYHFFTLVP